MDKGTLSVSIAHLYPDLLNIYGDLGNIIAFKNRCIWRGVDVNIEEIKAGSKIDPKKYDFYFIGGGQDTQQVTASNELLSNKSALLDAMNSNAVFLGICGGYQLLGKYYKPNDNKTLDGVGLLNAYTIAGEKRFIGNTVGTLKDLGGIKVVGFENHSGLTFLGGNTRPFLKITKGYGNNGKDKTEGARYKNVFGTYFHGPILPKNPLFTDYLIKLALEKKYAAPALLDELDDAIEIKTFNSCLKLR